MKKLSLGAALVAGCCLSAALGAGFAIYMRPANASRNSSGTMSATNGPYVSGTVISSAQINARFADIENEITSSADRSGRGGFLAPVRGTDGTVAAPSLSFTSETGSGLFRNGAGDVRMSILGSAKTFWNATGFGIGGAATDPFDITISGSASTVAESVLEASLADGNLVQRIMGKAASANLAGLLTYTKNATAANSTFCLGVFGGSASTLCVDGNNTTAVVKPTISTGVGANGSGFKHQRFTGLCTTAVGPNTTCDDVVTWTTAFADANYTVTCIANGGSGIDVGFALLKSIKSKIAAGITLRTMSTSASIASLPAADCIAVHD